MNVNTSRPAYTAFPVDGRTKLENCNSCFAVGFCDLFFSAGYIKDIIGGSPYKEQDLNDKRLVSREHSVIHEWMHNDPVGYDWRGKSDSGVGILWERAEISGNSQLTYPA